MGMRRGFCPAGFFPAAGNRRWAFSLPGKTGARRRAHTWKKPRACAVQMQTQTRCATCPAQARELPTAGVPVAGAGFFPAWENRSPAWGTHTEPAAGVRGSNADTNTVRDLLTAGGQDFFLLSFAFSCWLLPLKPLFICRSCRDGHPIFFSERKWGKRTARGRGSAPFEPHSSALWPISPFSRCWPA